jgi:hypothetical protein
MRQGRTTRSQLAQKDTPVDHVDIAFVVATSRAAVSCQRTGILLDVFLKSGNQDGQRPANLPKRRAIFPARGW